tara:strand:+ start:30 stop:506 length:477 start_codon:yes stop_codon:yes gene_type:complete
MTIQVRPAKIQDCHTIHAFIQELADYLELGNKMLATPEDLLRDGFCSNPKFFSIIAHEFEKPIGVAVYFFTYSSWAGRKVLNLHDIIVAQGHRRSGAGRLLLSYLAEEAERNDCARIDLEVRSYNEARKFYKELGFTQDKSNLIYELDRLNFKSLILS